MQTLLQPAYILHHRPYRETSVLLDLFTQDYGKISAVARGVRQSRSKWRPLIQLFVPLYTSWQGKGELVTLLTVEPNGPPSHLTGECLLSGLYLNELLMRLLQKNDPHAELYTIYQQTLLELQSVRLEPKTLRIFEVKLLEQLGYGIQFERDANSGHPLAADKYYRFQSEHGFELCPDTAAASGHANVFLGKSLIQIAQQTLEDTETLRDAKRLMRLALQPLLGPNPVQSRRLFEGIKTE